MDQERHNLFLKLVRLNQAKINAYILSLVPRHSDADDILQNTLEMIWHRFDKYQPGTNFLSWALSFAHYEVLNFRKKKARRHELIFNPDVFEQVLPVAAEQIKNTDPRRDALEHCVNKLDEKSRMIINLRYNMDIRPKEIGLRLGYTVANIYKTISRIHHKLMICIEQRLRGKGEMA